MSTARPSALGPTHQRDVVTTTTDLVQVVRDGVASLETEARRVGPVTEGESSDEPEFMLLLKGVSTLLERVPAFALDERERALIGARIDDLARWHAGRGRSRIPDSSIAAAGLEPVTPAAPAPPSPSTPVLELPEAGPVLEQQPADPVSEEQPAGRVLAQPAPGPVLEEQPAQALPQLPAPVVPEDPVLEHGAGEPRAVSDPRGPSPLRRRISQLMTVTGVVIVLFVGYLLVGSDVSHQRDQRVLEDRLQHHLVRASQLAAPVEIFFETDPATGDPQMPELIGQPLDVAVAALEGLELTVQVRATKDPDVPAGRVVGTDIETGAAVRSGADVVVEVSSGPPVGSPIAMLEIDAVGVEEVVVEATGASELKDGPGHYRASSMPGHVGNVVIAGRRSTYGGPFSRIGELDAGDEIRVTTVDGAFTYVVEATEVVERGDPDVIGPTDDDRLTLVTGHPRLRAAERLVVTAILDGEALPEPLGIDPPTDVEQTETGLFSDVRAWGPTLFWGQLVLGAYLGLRLMARRWRRWSTWLVSTPVLLVLVLVWFESIHRLFPSTL